MKKLLCTPKLSINGKYGINAENILITYRYVYNVFTVCNNALFLPKPSIVHVPNMPVLIVVLRRLYFIHNKKRSSLFIDYKNTQT